MATILDQYGFPVDLKLLTEPMAVPSVTGVRGMFTDAVAGNLTPARLAKILKGATEGDGNAYLTLAEEMEERDPHYQSVLGVRKRALTGLPLQVVAAGDDKASQDMADAVRNLLADPDLEENLEDLLDAFGKGYSVVEMNWDRGGARWRPRLEHCDARLFMWDQATGKRLRLRSAKEPSGLELPPFKFIVHNAKFKTGLPLRGGLARLVAWSHVFKSYTVKDWMAFCEVYGMPLRIGRYHANAKPAEIAVLKRAVAQLGTDAAAVLPDQMTIDFHELANTSSSGDLFLKAAEWLDRQVSKAVLGQTMTADNGSSKSQAEVHNEVRLDILRADAKALSKTLNRDLIRAYIDLNWGPQEAYPRLAIPVPERKDLKLMAEVLDKLVPMGLRVAVSEVRDQLGFPDPGENEEVLKAAPKPPTPPPGGGGVEPAAAANRALGAARNAAEVKPEGDALDELEALASGRWERIMPELIQPAAELAQGANSLEDFRDGLVDLVQKMPMERLQELVAQCTFTARAAGAVGADLG